ncbi:MAG: FeoB-associated Cys-rich membrane protein [Eubacterium sp.]|nr:FeoB-associated Cys-rich membrane protein [Eubacterium sp.]
MLDFLRENLSTIIIGLIILAVAVGIIAKMIKDKKNGKSSCNCGCGCENCLSAEICHKK